MITHVLPIDNISLEMAKNEIMHSGVVAFPTETVYGLAANAFDTVAVEKVFEVKGRPNDNPLIVHVHKDYDLSELVEDIQPYTELLSKAFLPGPLTMVYKSKGTVSRAVSCGLDTVAIRIPSHKGAQSFLKYVNVPIAAPSANLSKHVSPVTAQHVFDDLNGKISLILDGGKCSGGIESTVLDCTGKVPCVLRSGLISREMIAQVVGECDEYVFKDGEKVRSPGMKYKHYSPKCETVLFSFDDKEKAFELYKAKLSVGVKAFLMCDDEVAKLSGCADILNLGKTENEIAANLYDKLREGEAVAELIIAVAPQKQDGVMVGVMNRLKKACG
ncbi:MAG: threonylcarbamoyl-AMP synthase [Clostridia bacterium]|nr:threonylcarbamoyl-AMP synthase [Clostridia bacterium]